MDKTLANIDDLDTQDEGIKEYIDENIEPAKPTNLFCELEVDTDKGAEVRGRLYIKCYKGDILSTDTLQFARRTSTPMYWTYVDDSGYRGRRCAKRRFGWIIPKPYNNIRLRKVYDAIKSNASDKYDYWEILPKSRAGRNISWQELLDEFLQHRHDYGKEAGGWCKNAVGPYSYNYAGFVNRWCGVAVMRDGKNLTGYMRWQIKAAALKYAPNPEINCHFTSQYRGDGMYFDHEDKDVYRAYYLSI